LHTRVEGTVDVISVQRWTTSANGITQDRALTHARAYVEV